MQTVLFVSPMTLGDELAVRAVHDRLPVSALEGQGAVEKLRAYIGSGLYALELTVDDGDFQARFHEFLQLPEVAAFFQALQPHVRDLPRAQESTAAMPLTTRFMEWERGIGG